MGGTAPAQRLASQQASPGPPHGRQVARDSVQMASLDHALWIHRRVPMTDWLLFHKHTSSAGGARGLSHAEFFTVSGVLVASVSQEGLMREVTPR